MKLFAALALFLSAAAAQAAAPATCTVLVPSDPVNQPTKFDKTVLSFTPSSDDKTNYVVVAKDVQSAEVVSSAAYSQMKSDKFGAIDGQYVLFYLQDSSGLLSISLGKASAQTGAIEGGATVYSMNSQRTIMSPLNGPFGTICAPAGN